MPAPAAAQALPVFADPRRPVRKGVAAAGAEQPIAAPWRRRGFWVAFVAYWLVDALLFTGTQFARAAVQDHPLPLEKALLMAISDAVFTALHALGAFAIAWNLPLEGGRRRTARNLGLAILGALLVTPLLQCAMTGVGSFIAGVPFPPLLVLLMLTVPSQLLLFTAFLASGYAIRYYVTAGESSRAAVRLAGESARLEGELTRAELQLARSQLQVLKMQLDPHFLFNTFNAIAALMHRDAAAADAMLTRLSDLLRITLARAGDQEVTLGEEMEFLRLYLEIQQSRFGERLTLDWRVDPAAEGAAVPHLVLQPIVENAVQHGIARIPGPGRIGIAARREGARLVLEVTDSGPGLPDDWAPRPGGVGLSNTHARLEHMYGDTHTLEMYTRDEGGTGVVITLPYRAAARHANGGSGCA
jgi:signal transduction histidine kinase